MQPTNLLEGTRQVFWAFASALALIAVVTVFLTAGSEEPSAWPVGPTAVAVVVAGIVQLTTSRVVAGSLRGDTVGEIVTHWRARFFLRIAFAEAGALIGFAGSLLSHSPIPYLVGLVPAAIAFARAAPSDANIQGDQDELSARGCPVPLAQTLRDVSPQR